MNNIAFKYKRAPILLAGILMLMVVDIGIKNVSAQEPQAPVNLGIVVSSGRVVLSWDSVQDATAYNLYFSRHPGISNLNYKNLLGMKIGNVVSPYELTGLNNATAYYFVVTAKNSFGESLPSNEVQAVPVAVMLSPVQFSDISLLCGLEQNKKQAFGNHLLGDLNNDGNLDIIEHHHAQPMSIYLNNGAETFANIVNTSGIYNSQGIDRHGMALADFDNDGYLDLFITTNRLESSVPLLSDSQLWKGDGLGHFLDITIQAGISIPYGRSANWVDYNNDGYLDLVAAFESPFDGIVYKNDQNGHFIDVTSLAGLSNAFDTITSFADYDNDGDMDLFIGGSRGLDKLYRNNGDGAFSLNESFAAKGISCRGAAWGDYNNDGLIDLYVSRGMNDYYKSLYGDSSRIDFSFIKFIDPGDISFRCASGKSITFNLLIPWRGRKTSYIYIGSQRINPAQSPFILASDEITGRPQFTAGSEEGFFVWKEDTDNIWHIQWTKTNQGLGPPFFGQVITDGNFSALTSNTSTLDTNSRNTLYRNQGNGIFTDATRKSGLGHIGNNSGAAWADFDNDGYLDLYLVDASDILGNRTNTLYRNLGNGIFEDITASAGVDAVNAVGRHYGVAPGDFNNDGNLDILLSNGFGWGHPLASGKSILYKNLKTGNNWIKLNLIGSPSNRSGIGARVVLTTAKGDQTRQLNGAGGELYSQGLTPIHFGLGNENLINSITIHWPSGAKQALYDVSVNQELTVLEEDNGATPHIVFLPGDKDNWTDPGALALWQTTTANNTAPAADTQTYAAGISSISITRTGRGLLNLRTIFSSRLSLNPSSDVLHFKIYVQDANETLSYIDVWGANYNNRFRGNPALSLKDSVWTQIDIPLSSFTVASGSPDWRNIGAVVVNFSGGSSGDIKIDEFYFESVRTVN